MSPSPFTAIKQAPKYADQLNTVSEVSRASHLFSTLMSWLKQLCPDSRSFWLSCSSVYSRSDWTKITLKQVVGQSWWSTGRGIAFPLNSDKGIVAWVAGRQTRRLTMLKTTPLPPINWPGFIKIEFAILLSFGGVVLGFWYSKWPLKRLFTGWSTIDGDTGG